MIESLKAIVELQNEESFLSAINQFKSWDFQKISLYAVEEILNFADSLLEKYSRNITLNYSNGADNLMDIPENQISFKENNEKNTKKILIVIGENEEKIKIVLNFYKIILPNSLNKDIFCSFDHLSLIFKETMILDIKTKIIDIMMLFNGVKRNTIDNNLDFVDYFTFGIYLRPILTEDIVEKSRKVDSLREKNKGVQGIIYFLFF
jgi:vacuolar-type H+-ATPase catalytic subunit A/Vma1